MGGVLQYNGDLYQVRVNSFLKSPMALRVEIKNTRLGISSIRRITYNQGNWAKFNLQMPKNCSFVDVGQLSDVEDFLQSTGLAKPMIVNGSEITRNINNIWFPLYKFDEDMIKRLDPKGYASYSKGYDDQYARESFRYGMASHKSYFPKMTEPDLDYHQL